MIISRRPFVATINEVVSAQETLPARDDRIVWHPVQMRDWPAWRASLGRLLVWKSDRHKWCTSVRAGGWTCNAEWFQSRNKAMQAAEHMLRAMIFAREKVAR